MSLFSAKASCRLRIRFPWPDPHQNAPLRMQMVLAVGSGKRQYFVAGAYVQCLERDEITHRPACYAKASIYARYEGAVLNSEFRTCSEEKRVQDLLDPVEFFFRAGVQNSTAYLLLSGIPHRLWLRLNLSQPGFSPTTSIFAVPFNGGEIPSSKLTVAPIQQFVGLCVFARRETVQFFRRCLRASGLPITSQFSR